ncbi:hypothetical protein [Sulfitobacter indolifex]|uniref:hypothetical protein n=2 Tax=Sulfitobacter TaxID=60136 RepID=UPI00104E4703|nr:hypothetical protein [Sulfitobacter indolifex]
MELLHEEDFSELPEQSNHKWLELQKVVSSRFKSATEAGDESAQLSMRYMDLIATLAAEHKVGGIQVPSNGTLDDRLAQFEILTERAKAKIWSTGLPEYPLGRVRLANDVKSTILSLAAEIEQQLDGLEVCERRRTLAHKRLEAFRKEINQPQTRVGAALQQLAPVATVLAMATTTLAQGLDAAAEIQRLLGAEQLEASQPELRLTEEEKKLLLPPPPKQIEGPK